MYACKISRYILKMGFLGYVMRCVVRIGEEKQRRCMVVEIGGVGGNSNEERRTQYDV